MSSASTRREGGTRARPRSLFVRPVGPAQPFRHAAPVQCRRRRTLGDTITLLERSLPLRGMTMVALHSRRATCGNFLGTEVDDASMHLGAINAANVVGAALARPTAFGNWISMAVDSCQTDTGSVTCAL